MSRLRRLERCPRLGLWLGPGGGPLSEPGAVLSQSADPTHNNKYKSLQLTDSATHTLHRATNPASAQPWLPTLATEPPARQEPSQPLAPVQDSPSIRDWSLESAISLDSLDSFSPASYSNSAMLVTPLATVRRAASRAREASETRLAALRDGVEEAVDYLTGSYDNSDDQHHDQHLARSYHSHLSRPERTDDPDEAGEGDSTIVPLLSEQSNRGPKPGRPRPTCHSRTSSYQSSYHSEYDDTAEIVEQKLRPVERVVAYAIFFVLGACTLLAWNAEIVQGAYFKARLEGSAYEVSFSSWLTLTFTSCNLIFLALSNYTQHGANYGRRIQWSNLTLLGVMILFIISTQLKEINPT